MFKYAMFVLAIVATAFVLKSDVVNAQVPPQVTICHRTSSSPNSNNPYNQMTLPQSAVDGQGNGNGDHYANHDGPLITSMAQYQQFKNDNLDWGDIIPPVPGFHAGLNWTAEGQAIWANDCNFVTQAADITYDVTCDADGVVVSLTNHGQTDGAAEVNGVSIAVAAGATVTAEYESGDNIEIVIDQQTVFDEVVTCGGRGGVDPVDPVAQVDAPEAGVNAGSGAIAAIVGLASSIAAVAYGALRLRKATSL